jgi:hypothetical protein
MITLAQNGEQYREIIKLFNQCYNNQAKVINVLRIENRFLWDKYDRERKKITEKGNVNECMILHNFKGNDYMNICTNGFDISLAKEYGKSGKDLDAEEKLFKGKPVIEKGTKGYMFLAWAVTGKSSLNQCSVVKAVILKSII